MSDSFDKTTDQQTGGKKYAQKDKGRDTENGCPRQPQATGTTTGNACAKTCQRATQQRLDQAPAGAQAAFTVQLHPKAPGHESCDGRTDDHAQHFPGNPGTNRVTF